MEYTELARPKGTITADILYDDGRVDCLEHSNIVLRAGREALAKMLANRIGDNFDFFISRMIFGDSGTNGGVPKFVNTARSGLFGTTRVNKPVSVTIDAEIPSQVVFTSVVGFQEGNGFTLNEMALVMDNGDLYSMATFPDIGKTSSMQVVWNWRLSFV